jgi:hypothetical protein
VVDSVKGITYFTTLNLAGCCRSIIQATFPALGSGNIITTTKALRKCCQTEGIWERLWTGPFYGIVTPFASRKGKAIPITGHGDPYGCETSRIPHFLDNRLTDGDEVGHPLPPTQIPCTNFCVRLSQLQGHSAAGRICEQEMKRIMKSFN